MDQRKLSIHSRRNAKIVATVGPASASPEVLRAMCQAGVDTFRLNFSHGSHDAHALVVHEIRALEEVFGRPIGILQDLQGPKIRIGKLPELGVAVHADTRVHFTMNEPYSEFRFPLPHAEVFAVVKEGDHILVDDGRVRFQIERCDEEFFVARALNSGTILSRKGVNLPGTVLDLSPLTTKDRKDLAFGLSLGVDLVALSFVQQPSDLVEARTIIGDRAGLVAKIEKPTALDRIEGIIALSDAVMIARGDLGVEISPEEVPGRQKELVAVCRRAGKPVIVATQMLESMVASPVPTRAEASDVATAIYDGADAVMLSAETATGRHPVESVSFMSRIISQTERHRLYSSIMRAVEPDVQPTIPHAVAGAAASLANALSASVVVAFTVSGTTAMRVARERPKVPILALTTTLAVARQLCIIWGITSLHLPGTRSFDDTTGQAVEAARRVGVAEGATLVVVAGIPIGVRGKTNNIQVVNVE